MNHRTRAVIVTATALIGLTGLAGCASSGGSAASGSSSSAAPSASAPAPPSASAAGGSDAAGAATITIKNYGYAAPATVAPGTRITVTNDDSEVHTVTSDKGGAFDVKIDPGASATFTAPAAGTYPFHCTYHANMHGTLTVA